MRDKGADFLDSQAEQRPTVHTFADIWPRLQDLWENGLPKGDSTGFLCLDEFYTVAPGQLTLVTGWPGSGKSEFVDQLLVNLTRVGWQHAIFSPENQPLELHAAKIAEKVVGKPFSKEFSGRMGMTEIGDKVPALTESFRFVSTPRDSAVTIPTLLDTLTPIVEGMTGRRRGLVIDPWNELEHWRPSNMSETEYISKALSLLRNWGRELEVHVWLVAHPQKLRRVDDKLPIPTPDTISGSSHFWNKADVCMCVHRDFAQEKFSKEVSVIIQKMRFKHIGKRGMATLRWEPMTGRYVDPAARPTALRSWT